MSWERGRLRMEMEQDGSPADYEWVHRLPSAEALLPSEFKSGNDIPVDRAYIKRERMLEIIQEILDCKLERSEDEKGLERDHSKDAERFLVLVNSGAYTPNPFLPSDASCPWSLRLSSHKASLQDLRAAVDQFQGLKNKQ